MARSSIQFFGTVALCATSMTLGGCRHVDNVQTDLLERELRQQEDYIYELEDYLMEYSEKLRQARIACQPGMEGSGGSSPQRGRAIIEPRSSALRNTDSKKTFRSEAKDPSTSVENELPPHSAGTAAAESTDDASATSNPPKSAVEPSPGADEAAPAATDPSLMEAPELEIGDPGASHAPAWSSPGIATGRDASPASVLADQGSRLDIPDPAEFAGDQEAAASGVAEVPVETPADSAVDAAHEERLVPIPQGEIDRTQVAKLVIRRIFSGESGANNAQQANALHEAGSLLVVVEAKNAADEPIEVDGAASLMVLQSDAPGSYRRIERWDFSAEESQASWQSSRLGDGLHLELPLAAGPLPAGKLELFVRFVGGDGRKLLASAPFDAAQLTSTDDVESATPLAAEPEPPRLLPIATQSSEPSEKSTIAQTTHQSAVAVTADHDRLPATQQWRRARQSFSHHNEGLRTTTQSSPTWTARPSGTPSSASPALFLR